MKEPLSIRDGKLNIWKAVVLPLKNKLFFLWSESMETLNEMVNIVFKN